MRQFISLLQGINVGGQKRIAMEALRALYRSVGVVKIQSYVQSGNVLFAAEEENPAALTKKIEARILEACGFSVKVFLRTPADFHRILAGNPFLEDRKEDPSKLHVSFLYHPVNRSIWSNVIVPPGIIDEFIPGEAEVYLFCPDGYGKTKLSNSFFERKLKVPVTTRNWNTVEALYRMAQDVP
jgi:uncharacterized protein (DUF1697 family)